MPPRSTRASAKPAAAAAPPPASSKARKGTKRQAKDDDESNHAAASSAELDAPVPEEATTAARKMARTTEDSVVATAASASSSAASSAASAPALSFPAYFRAGSCVLYRDALQSLLRFLGLSDVNCLLRVCRGWSGAVRGAPSVHGHYTPRIGEAGSSNNKESKLAWARSVVSSEMGSRLEGIGALPYQTLVVDCALLETMVRRLPALRSLAASLLMPLPSGGALPHFPSVLQTLHLVFEKPASPRDIHTTLFTIASDLRSLQRLTLWLPHAGSKVHFNALSQCAALRHFTLVFQGYNIPLLSSEHLAALRLIGPKLHSLSVDLAPHQPAKLFAGSPHPFAELQELRPTKPNKPLVIDASFEAALARVPSLTRLHTLWKGLDLAWLAPSVLPSLRELRFEAWGSSLTPPQILLVLANCTQLTSFELDRGPGMWELTAEQLGACIAGMHDLQKLGVMGFDFTSLCFLPLESESAAAHSKLRNVRLTGLDTLPPAELRRLSAMGDLQRVEIESCCQVSKSTALQLRELILQSPCSLDAAALVVRDTVR